MNQQNYHIFFNIVGSDSRWFPQRETEVVGVGMPESDSVTNRIKLPNFIGSHDS